MVLRLGIGERVSGVYLKAIFEMKKKNTKFINVLLIIPCYNEAKRLPKNRFLDFSKDNDYVDFLFVNDGSTDNTVQVLKKLSEDSDKMTFLNLKSNVGKAEAIRQGVLSINNPNKYDYIGYFDADLAMPLSEVHHFLYFIDINGENITKMAMGCRLRRLGASIERTFFRHIVSRTFATIVSYVLKMKVYDTQNGAKLISSDLVRDLFKEPFITKWLFDVELLFRLKRLLGSKDVERCIVEVPLNTCLNPGGSKLKIKDFVKAPWELFLIQRKYNK